MPYIIFYIALGVLGLILGYPNPLLHLPPLVLLFPISIFFLCLQAKTRRNAFVLSWITALFAFAGALYWLVVPMHKFGGLPIFLAIPCVFLLSAYLAIFPAFFGLCLKSLGDKFQVAQKTKTVNLFAFATLLSLLWAGLELLNSIILTGFPWVNLATSFAFWPSFIQLASLVGNYLLSGFFVFICLLFSLSLVQSESIRIKLATTSLILFMAIPLYGKFIISQGIDKSRAPVSFGLIQGNIDQTQKWEPAYQAKTLNSYISLSQELIEAEKAKGEKLDILVWPETAMPFYYQSAEPYGTILRHLALNEKTPIIFGTLGYGNNHRRDLVLYNRMQSITYNGETGPHYDKQHLVPFGEYIPFEIHLEFLKNILQGMSFSAGTAKEPLNIMLPASTSPSAPGSEKNLATEPRELRLGALICYEAIFQDLAQRHVESGAELFINISNDAWFGRTSAPLQHLSLAILRAVEQRRPIVRSTNTGYTTSIDSLGRLSKQTKLFEDASLAVKVYPQREHSLYFYLSNYIDYLLFLGVLVNIFLTFHRKKKI